MPKRLKHLWLVFLIPFMVHAVPTIEKYHEGEDYTVLSNPVQTSVKKGRIEVAELFWYGCPHCYTLESIVQRWKPSLPDDVQVVRVPAFFGPNIWKVHAQLYYALQSMVTDKQELDIIHSAIFNEIQNRRNRLGNPDAMAKFLTKKFSLDPDRFRSYYNSFGVLNLLNQAGSKLRSYGLNGVPALVVDGRYLVQPYSGLDKMPEVVDFLIKKVRAERTDKMNQKSTRKDTAPAAS